MSLFVLQLLAPPSTSAYVTTVNTEVRCVFENKAPAAARRFTGQRWAGFSRTDTIYVTFPKRNLSLSGSYNFYICYLVAENFKIANLAS